MSKKNRTFHLIFTLLFILFFISACNQKSNGKGENIEIESDKYYQSLGSIMLDIQSRHTKLYYAGMNNNWELANFLVQEIEESFKEITRYHRSHDEINLNKLTNQMIMPSIENLEKVIQLKDVQQFDDKYDQLTVSCNNCHKSSKHEFIKIVKPINGDFLNQDFSK